MDKTKIKNGLKLLFLIISIGLSGLTHAETKVMSAGELNYDLSEIEGLVFEGENWNLILSDEAFNAKRGTEFLYCSIVGDILGNSAEAKGHYELGMSFLDAYAKQVVESVERPKTSDLLQQFSVSMANYQFVENKDILKGMVYQNLAERITKGWIQVGEGKEESKKRYQQSYSKYCNSL